MKVHNWQVTLLNECEEKFWLEWQVLFSQCHAHNPMLDSKFVRSLVSYYPAKIYVAKGLTSGSIVALCLLEKNRFGQWKNYMPSQSQLALCLITPNTDCNLTVLMKALSWSAMKLDLYGLDPQEHTSLINTVDHSQNYAQNIKLQISGDFDSYWLCRAKRLRKDITKSNNRLAKDGVVLENKAIVDLDKIEAAVDRYGMLESQGWKGKNGTAIHPSNIQGQFYLNLMNSFANNTQGLVFESYIEGQLVASRLCIFNKDTLIILKTTFDENFSYYALGNFNRFKLIEYLFNNSISKCVDFYTNASKEQLYWSTEQRTMFNASVYRFSVIASGILAIKRMKNRLFSRQKAIK